MRRLDRALGCEPSPWHLPEGATREELRAEQAVVAMGGDPGPLVLALLAHIERGTKAADGLYLTCAYSRTVSRLHRQYASMVPPVRLVDRALHALPAPVRVVVLSVPDHRTQLVDARRVTMICRCAETARGRIVYPIRLLRRRPDGKVEACCVEWAARGMGRPPFRRVRNYRLRRTASGVWRAARIREG